MTELAHLAPDDSERTREPAEMSELVRWANDARQAHQVAMSLAQTSFVPASLRAEPRITPRMNADEEAVERSKALAATAANITGAILTGSELGLQPMAALRSMDIIQGTPALRAHAMRGLVQSQGHEVELVESTPETCVMRGRRYRGVLSGGKGEWQTITWTIERARQLGLTGKDQWKKQPQAMLVARATGELCRLVAADVLFAVPYAAEELDGDRPASSASQSVPVTAAEILGTREPVDAPTEPASVLQRESDAPSSVGADPEKDRRRLFAILGELGVKEREDRLAVYSAVVGRAVASTDELDPTEVQGVADTLDGVTRYDAEHRVEEVGGLIVEGQAIRTSDTDRGRP